MKISIITVCKNSEKYIEGAIASVLDQSYSDIEYIIIDGNSTDRTQQIINQYSKFISKFISESDRGLYEAMNKGIKLATGSFLYFLNSDDRLFDRDVIKDIVSFISDHQNCDFIYGDVQTKSGSGDMQINKPVDPDQILDEMICLGNCPIQPACFFKADLFSKLGYFNQNYKIAADYEWFIRLFNNNLSQPLNLFYFSRSIVVYDRGGLSSNVNKVFGEVFDIQNSSLLFQTKYWLNQRIVKLQESTINTQQLISETEKLSAKRLAIIEHLEQSKTIEFQTAWNKFKELIKKIVKP